MSERDAQLVREMWEELARHSPVDADDFSRFAELTWHPDIVYDEDPRWPGSDTYTGRDAVKAAFDGYHEVMGSASVSVERVVDGGELQVVLVRFAGRSPGSNVPWEHVWGYTCRLRDGKLIHLRAYWDSEEALAAAGASPP